MIARKWRALVAQDLFEPAARNFRFHNLRRQGGQPHAGQRRIHDQIGGVEYQLAFHPHIQLARSLLEFPGIEPAAVRQPMLRAVNSILGNLWNFFRAIIARRALRKKQKRPLSARLGRFRDPLQVRGLKQHMKVDAEGNLARTCRSAGVRLNFSCEWLAFSGMAAAANGCIGEIRP